MSLRRALVAALFLSLVAWLALRPQNVADGSGESDPRIIKREFLAMGTRVTVTLHLDADRTPAQASAAITDVEHYFRESEHVWASTGNGTLADLNRSLETGQIAAISPTLQPLFARAWQLSVASGGLFEPRIGALVRLWGFDDITRLRAAPPVPAEISAAVAALHAAPPYDGGVQYGPAQGVSWDFGAIAKGYAVDTALAQLRTAGFNNAIVDAGGNLAVRGRKGTQPWRIAIRNPRGDSGKRFLATIDADDEAVNTHGDYERYFEYRGRRYCHILDPTTGSPADALESVTVVNRDGTVADAGGAALFVAGPTRWRELARELDLDQILVVDAQNRVSVTPRLAARLHLEAGVAVQLVP